MPKPARRRRPPAERADISVEALKKRLPASQDEFYRAGRVQALHEVLSTAHPDDADPPVMKGSR